MAEHPFMPVATDAYLSDTTHLSTIEHGAYFLLLMCMWRSGGSLPDNDKLLARYTKLTAGQWRRIKPILMSFFTVKNGQIMQGHLIMQGRLTDELNAVGRLSKSLNVGIRPRGAMSDTEAAAT